MAVAEQSMTQSHFAERLRTDVQSFAREHRRMLQITGVVAVAGVTGAVGGLIVAKGIAATKGTTVANLALATKGALATKAGATPLVTALVPQTTSAVGTAAATVPTATVPAATSLSQVISMLNHSATNGVALADKATALWNTVSTNVLPLTAGAVGGGAAGVGITQTRVRKVQEQLDEQRTKTEGLQTATSQLLQSLSTTEAQLQLVQEQLPPPAASQPPIQEPTTPALPAQPAVPPTERLEQIHGIGRAFAGRLNDAGIYTIGDLAAQTPAALEAIIGRSRAGAVFDPQAWINEARTLNRLPGGVDPTVTETAPSVVAAAAETVDLVLERLESIAGISPAIAARLNRAGILTYGDLAAQRPEQVAAMLDYDPAEPLDEMAAWINAAQRFSAQE